MRNVLLSNYEVISIVNSSNKSKDLSDESKKKVVNISKEKELDSFSILLDTQLKSMR